MIFKLWYNDDKIYDIELTKCSDVNDENNTTEYYFEIDVFPCMGSSMDLFVDLYKKGKYDKQTIRKDFTFIDELRGWLWEDEYAFRKNSFDEKTINAEYPVLLTKVRQMLTVFAKKYGLSISED